MSLHLSLAPSLHPNALFSPMLLPRQQAYEIYQLLSAAISQGDPDLIKQASDAASDLTDSLRALSSADAA